MYASRLINAAHLTFTCFKSLDAPFNCIPAHQYACKEKYT